MDKGSPSCARAGIDEVSSSSVERVIACKQQQSWAPIFCRGASFPLRSLPSRDRTSVRRERGQERKCAGGEWPSPPALDMGMRELASHRHLRRTAHSKAAHGQRARIHSSRPRPTPGISPTRRASRPSTLRARPADLCRSPGEEARGPVCMVGPLRYVTADRAPHASASSCPAHLVKRVARDIPIAQAIGMCSVVCVGLPARGRLLRSRPGRRTHRTSAPPRS